MIVNEARDAFEEIASEFAPHLVYLPWHRAPNLQQIALFCKKNLTGFMVRSIYSGLHYWFSEQNDAIFFKLTFR